MPCMWERLASVSMAVFPGHSVACETNAYLTNLPSSSFPTELFGHIFWMFPYTHSGTLTPQAQAHFSFFISVLSSITLMFGEVFMRTVCFFALSNSSKQRASLFLSGHPHWLYPPYTFTQVRCPISISPYPLDHDIYLVWYSVLDHTHCTITFI